MTYDLEAYHDAQQMEENSILKPDNYEDKPILYLIKPGIASYVSVTCDLFPCYFGTYSQDYFYMAEGKPIEQAPAGQVPFDTLPKEVQDAINEHYKKVFALPVAQRQEYIYTLGEIEVLV